MLNCTPSLRAQDDAPAVVQKLPPDNATIPFDPSNPPPEMPPRKGNEDAWCRFAFNCQIRLKYDVERSEEVGGQVRATCRLTAVSMTLTLKNTIYLPSNATDKLRRHEEGHRTINERVYERAEIAAREVAEMMMQRPWEGTGVDERAAGKAATDAAVQAIGNEYLKRVSDRAFAIGEVYDEITKHGTNAWKEDKAIEEAFKRYDSSGGKVPATRTSN